MTVVVVMVVELVLLTITVHTLVVDVDDNVYVVLVVVVVWVVAFGAQLITSMAGLRVVVVVVSDTVVQVVAVVVPVTVVQVIVKVSVVVVVREVAVWEVVLMQMQWDVLLQSPVSVLVSLRPCSTQTTTIPIARCVPPCFFTGQSWSLSRCCYERWKCCLRHSVRNVLQNQPNASLQDTVTAALCAQYEEDVPVVHLSYRISGPQHG